MNIPNILSIFRMCLVPVFVLFFFSKDPSGHFYAAAIYALAGITDIADGIIARKFNLITKLGTVLDPLADKLMTITVFICITIRGIIPWWVILILFAKDLLLIIGGVKLYKDLSEVISANAFGKSATVFLVCGGIILTLFPENIPLAAETIYLTIALLLSILAFCSYLHQYIRHQKNKAK